MFDFIEIDRNKVIKEFLAKQGYDKFDHTPLKGDASRRNFIRLSKNNKRVILIDADPTRGEEPLAYAAITKILLENNITVPQIIGHDILHGLFIVEDFGDTLLTQALTTKELSEKNAYKKAIQILLDVQKIPLQKKIDFDNITYNITQCDIQRLISEAKIFLDWYVPELTKRPTSHTAKDEFVTILQGMLTPIFNGDDVLVLRDYHADNIMIMGDDETTQAQMGLLDFQDAIIGNKAYDVVSLLQDARYAVPDDIQSQMLEHYISKAKIQNQENFLRDYYILGAQRNIKILGIFARLFVLQKKDRYLQYMPNVWSNLEKSLAQPPLKPLKDWFDRWVPLPLRKAPLNA